MAGFEALGLAIVGRYLETLDLSWPPVVPFGAAAALDEPHAPETLQWSALALEYDFLVGELSHQAG